VVLIGEDSLEANVGHLAAMTGGTVVVALGGDAGDALQAAANFLRLPAKAVERTSGLPKTTTALRGNPRVTAEWQQATKTRSDHLMGRAVVAVATGLALSGMDEDVAARLSEEEGLTTHLTSLVLVDEASEAQEAVPATRKVPLPMPRTAVASGFPLAALIGSAALRPTGRAAFASLMRTTSVELRPPGKMEYRPSSTETGPRGLAALVGRVDWDLAPTKLQSGDLSGLDEELAEAIRIAAHEPGVAALAQQLNISPVVLVIALTSVAGVLCHLPKQPVA
jgi:hypothetical protein